MRNKEYSWYILLNVPNFGKESRCCIFKKLLANKISTNDWFDMRVDELSKLFPKIRQAKFSEANEKQNLSRI